MECPQHSGIPLQAGGYTTQVLLLGHIAAYHYPYVETYQCPGCRIRVVAFSLLGQHFREATDPACHNNPCGKDFRSGPKVYQSQSTQYNEYYLPPFARRSLLPMVEQSKTLHVLSVGPFRFHHVVFRDQNANN